MKRQCIQVEKKKGEKIRKLLMEKGWLDTSLRIVSDESYLYMPLISDFPADINKLTNELPFEVQLTEHEFETQKKPKTVEQITGHIARYEIIGSIALLDHDEVNLEKTADAIIQVHPHVKTVLAALSAVEGEFRTRRFTLIKGENTTQTLHKEYGCRYAIDMEKAYFTPRLATERSRIMEQVKDGDTVVDMFAGVGPFSILIAKKRPSCRVIAIDKNPEAVKLLRNNISLNGVTNVEAVEADVRDVIYRYAGTADHVIMNLPHTAEEFLDSAMVVAKVGSVIHYYDITPESDLYSSSLAHIESAASKAGFTIKSHSTRIVRSYSPHQFNVCIEVRIT